MGKAARLNAELRAAMSPEERAVKDIQSAIKKGLGINKLPSEVAKALRVEAEAKAEARAKELNYSPEEIAKRKAVRDAIFKDI